MAQRALDADRGQVKAVLLVVEEALHADHGVGLEQLEGGLLLVEAHGAVGEEGIAMMTPGKKRELEHFRWVRDHAEEAAASLLPGDIRMPEKLRHGAQQMIDLIEKGQIPGRRK